MNWAKAETHLKEVMNTYATPFGMPQANPVFGLAYLKSLLQRYNSGEQTRELHAKMLSCEPLIWKEEMRDVDQRNQASA